MKKIACILIIFICLLCIHTSSFADSVKLPSGLIEIKEEAFYQDTNITEVEVPIGTKTIGARAFANSGLRKISLPDTIDSIDPTAFDNLSQDFIIVAPFNSYGYHFAIDHEIGWGDTANNSFLQWMLQNIDANRNGLFDENEIAGVTSINCNGQGFTSLEGVEIFYNLQFLDCGKNALTDLYVNNNLNLETLYCYTNQLTNLNVSNILKLKALECADNKLEDLNVGNNTALTYLGCSYNQLTSLDVRNNTALIETYCHHNEITSLDIKNLTELEVLSCGYNQLANLDVSRNTKLQYFNLSSNKLTNLDLSSNTELLSLQCWYNRLTNINLRNNTKLIGVNLSSNIDLSDLTLGNTQNLEMLRVQNTSLSQLDLRGAPILVQAYTQGVKKEFETDGSLSNDGSFVGYYLGDGLSPESQREIDHCQLCFDKTIEVIT